jgi:predicted phage-related endonuclease
MIKLTLRDIAPMIESLNNVMNLPLPAKESYRLGVAAKLIQDRITVYEKARQNLVAKYGERVEQEGVIRVKPENIEDFNKEIEGLLKEEVEVNMNPISIDLLGDNKVNARDMANLSPFFCETEDAVKN